jgi:hypothetical protein
MPDRGMPYRGRQDDLLVHLFLVATISGPGRSRSRDRSILGRLHCSHMGTLADMKSRMVPAEDSEEVLADLADALPHSSVFVVLWNMVQVRTVRMGLADRMGAREAVSSVK